MSVHPTAATFDQVQGEDRYRATHRGVVERLADPYLTDHDRWVLRQFAHFLSGRTPEPDPRAVRALAATRARRPLRAGLYPRVRPATL
jgi:hypothetical protein